MSTASHNPGPDYVSDWTFQPLNHFSAVRCQLTLPALSDDVVDCDYLDYLFPISDSTSFVYALTNVQKQLTYRVSSILVPLLRGQPVYYANHEAGLTVVRLIMERCLLRLNAVDFSNEKSIRWDLGTASLNWHHSTIFVDTYAQLMSRSPQFISEPLSCALVLTNDQVIHINETNRLGVGWFT